MTRYYLPDEFARACYLLTCTKRRIIWILITMTCYIAILLMTIIALPIEVPCSVVVDVGLQSFIYEGKAHCDNIFGFLKCDPYFVVCVGTRNQSCMSNVVRTSTARNKDELADMLHDKQISPDPISFKIDSFQEIPFVVRIEVINNNPIHDKLIDTVTWVYNDTTTFTESGVKLTGENGKARLTVSFLVRCDVNFYGPSCDRYCTPDQHSRCDKNGNRQCLPGFTGNGCNISVQSSLGTSNTYSTHTNHRRKTRSVGISLKSVRSINTMSVDSTSQTAEVPAVSVTTNPPKIIPSVSRLHSVSAIQRETTEQFGQTDSTTVGTSKDDTPTKGNPRYQTTVTDANNETVTFSPKTVSTTQDNKYSRTLSLSPPSSTNTVTKVIISTKPPQILSTQTSETALNTSLETDTPVASTSEKNLKFITTKRQHIKTTMPTRIPPTLANISTIISSKITKVLTTPSVESTINITEVISTQQARTSTVVNNSTVFQSTHESTINASIQITGKSAGLEHERSGKTSGPVQGKPWIMPLAITLTAVAVIMAIVAAVIFNYFKKKQRSVSYIDLLDNDAEVEIFSGGSLHLQLEPQTSNQAPKQIHIDELSDDTSQNES